MVDTLITLFESTATTFTTNGLGGLPDAVSCVVTEERNGEFELEMEYPIDGLHYQDISIRRLIVCKPNPFGNKQAFRIYSISKPMNGIVTINAEHISYDLSGVVVTPFGEVKNAQAALTDMKTHAYGGCPFEFMSDVTQQGTFEMTVPKSIRNMMGGEEGSVLDIFGGEYEFNNYSVYLRNNRGSDRGVTIRYGKNLTDIKQDENCSNVYTGVYPYYYRDSEDGGLVTLDEKVINVEGTFNYQKILSLDLSSEFDDKPDSDALKARAQQYIKDNNIGVPKVTLNVSFIQLAQSEEYKEYQMLERVSLCDKVSVYFPKLGVTNEKVQCIKTVYNVLTDKYNSIELGESETNLSHTIASQNDKINKVPSTSFMEEAAKHAAQMITGGLGGYVVLHASNQAQNGYPDEILIMDHWNIKLAKHVWRWNKAGLGYSSNGYDPDKFDTAWTIDGKFNANYIASGIIKAIDIYGSTIYNGDSQKDKQANRFDGNGITTVTNDVEVKDGVTGSLKAVLESEVFTVYRNEKAYGDKDNPNGWSKRGSINLHEHYYPFGKDGKWYPCLSLESEHMPLLVDVQDIYVGYNAGYEGHEPTVGFGFTGSIKFRVENNKDENDYLRLYFNNGILMDRYIDEGKYAKDYIAHGFD